MSIALVAIDFYVLLPAWGRAKGTKGVIFWYTTNL
jgi:hypothetical protein